MPKAGTKKNIRFLGVLARGENPKGFTAQTANGTAKSGNNKSGWNKDYDWERSMVEPVGAWKGNRTGE